MTLARRIAIVLALRLPLARILAADIVLVLDLAVFDECAALATKVGVRVFLCSLAIVLVGAPVHAFLHFCIAVESRRW